MATSDWERRKPQQRAATNADQSECMAIRFGATNLESGMFDDRLADAMDDFAVVDPEGVADWAEEDAKIDTAASEIGNEILRRKNILGEHYPFEKDGNVLRYIGSYTFAYEFCLAISQSPSLKEGEFTRLPPAFERLARDVAVCFLGVGGNGFRTGWPPDEHSRRHTRFKMVMEQLRGMAGVTGEWNWSPSPGRPDDPPHQHVKDEGLDFVVWKLMPDERPGNLFLIGQCACGGDWDQKFAEVDVGRLGEWMRPVTAAPALRVFATPHHIPNRTLFRHVNEKAGLTLDRVRITMLAENATHQDYINAQTKDPYDDLIWLVLDP